jgi:hypothetical protein
MSAIRFTPVLCAFALLFAMAFAQIAEAKAKTHRRHVDRYHRHGYENRRQPASPPVLRDNGRNRNGSEWDASCFSLPQLPSQYSCSASGGGAM